MDKVNTKKSSSLTGIKNQIEQEGYDGPGLLT